MVLVLKKLREKNYLSKYFKKDKNFISVCMLSRINIYKGQENLIKLLAEKKNNLQKFKFFF